MSKSAKTYSPEFRERAVRMVLDNHEQHESRWAAIRSVSSKIGCSTNALHMWISKSEADSGGQSGVTTKMGEVLPRRWVVERNFAWHGRCRRLTKDWEKSVASAEAWIDISHIRLTTRRLASYCYT